MNEIQCSEFQSIHGGLSALHGVGTCHHYPLGKIRFLKFRKELKSVHLGHVNVQNDGIVGILFYKLECFDAVNGTSRNFKSFIAAYYITEHSSHECRVVNYKDFFLHIPPVPNASSIKKLHYLLRFFLSSSNMNLMISSLAPRSILMYWTLCS